MSLLKNISARQLVDDIAIVLIIIDKFAEFFLVDFLEHKLLANELATCCIVTPVYICQAKN